MATACVSTTSKDRECILIENYIYYCKRTNKDSSKNYVCRDCTASITMVNGEVSILNGKKAENMCTDVIINSHKEHQALNETELLRREFKSNLKKRIACESGPIQQIYQDEQTKIVKNIDLASASVLIPQYENIRSGLYKHKSKYIPAITVLFIR